MIKSGKYQCPKCKATAILNFEENSKTIDSGKTKPTDLMCFPKPGCEFTKPLTMIELDKLVKIG